MSEVHAHYDHIPISTTILAAMLTDHSLLELTTDWPAHKHRIAHYLHKPFAEEDPTDRRNRTNYTWLVTALLATDHEDDEGFDTRHPVYRSICLLLASIEVYLLKEVTTTPITREGTL